MKIKGAILLIILTARSICCLSQNPEKIQTAGSANIKPPSDKAMDLYNKGHNSFNNKDYKSAIRSYEMAIAIDTDYIDAYNNLGLTFYESGLMDSAAFYLQKSLQKNPSGTTAIQNIALVEEKRVAFPKALEYYKQIKTLEPQNPEGFYNCARVLANMAKLDEALTEGLEAEKLYTKIKSPYVADCHYLLLMIYFNMNNKAVAKKYLAFCKKENVAVPAEIENGLK
ncbi:MAG: tetratricopeptide repeat protein [Bacteroidota bacterium]